MPSTSPIAHPVRQCRVAVIAVRHASFMRSTIYPLGVLPSTVGPCAEHSPRSRPSACWRTACSDEPLADTTRPGHHPDRRPPPTPTPTTPTPDARTDPGARPTSRPRRAMAHVRHLAGGIGPRLATGAGVPRGGGVRRDRARAQRVRRARQAFPVPAGDSWGVPVEAGRSFNVVAHAARTSTRAAPYRLVGAHLDTVAVAPGAEDNASRRRRAARARPARCAGRRGQVVLVAFGAEEPVGAGDLHHFGSKHYVAEMTGAERRNLRAMVSLDRVGVGAAVPLASFTGGRRPGSATSWPGSPTGWASRRVVGLNTTSDHESFARPGCRRRGSAARLRRVPLRRRPAVRRPARPAATGSAGCSARGSEAAELPEQVEDPVRVVDARRPGARSRRRSGTARSPPPSAGRPRTSPRAPAPPWSPAMKSMSKTKLPSEFTTSASPTSDAPCTQCGWPPTTRSAPARDQPPRDLRLDRPGPVGVLRRPSAAAPSRRRRAAPAGVRRRGTRSSSARSSGPVRGGMLTETAPGSPGRRLRCLADRVEAEEPEADAVPARDRRLAGPRPGRGRPRTSRSRPPAAGARSRPASVAVVAGVVVGQAERVEPGGRRSARTRGSAEKSRRPGSAARRRRACSPGCRR